jgi:agmatine deiminase
MSTAAQDGLAMPPAWAPHGRCWMAWPCREAGWGDAAGLDLARKAYADVARAIARFEPVTMLAAPRLVAGASLGCGSTVAVMPMRRDDSFLRDNGPTFVTDGRGGVAGVTFRFNGYGGRYEDFAADAATAKRLLATLRMRRYKVPLTLEGGAIVVDGEGTLITTESVLLDEKRNPGKERKEIETILADALGINKVVWLAGGLENDGTGGHVQMLAAFARPGVVMATLTNDANDINFPVLKENLERLKRATDARGRVLDIVPLPQPTPRRVGGRRLPLSYANFYLANGAAIVPAFGDALDEQAMAAIRAAFPDREAVQLDAYDLFVGGGGISAITCPQPAGEALT